MANNDDRMIVVMKDMYPKELVLAPDESDGLSTPFLDFQLVMRMASSLLQFLINVTLSISKLSNFQL